jgi:hypothetical protein
MEVVDQFGLLLIFNDDSSLQHVGCSAKVTALTIAAFHGDTESAGMLVEAGADVDSSDSVSAMVGSVEGLRISQHLLE